MDVNMVFVSGDVFYRSKFLKSNTYKRNIKADRIVVSEFGTMIYPDPCKNIFARYRPPRTPRDLILSNQGMLRSDFVHPGNLHISFGLSRAH